jgi:hypothetical protein
MPPHNVEPPNLVMVYQAPISMAILRMKLKRNSLPSMANAVIHPTTGANMEYRGLVFDEETFPIWDRAAANEFGRLAQGVGGRIEGSNTIYFIPRSAKLLHMVALLLIYDQTRKKSIECA